MALHASISRRFCFFLRSESLSHSSPACRYPRSEKAAFRKKAKREPRECHGRCRCCFENDTGKVSPLHVRGPEVAPSFSPRAAIGWTCRGGHRAPQGAGLQMEWDRIRFEDDSIDSVRPFPSRPHRVRILFDMNRRPRKATFKSITGIAICQKRHRRGKLVQSHMVCLPTSHLPVLGSFGSLNLRL